MTLTRQTIAQPNRLSKQYIIHNFSRSLRKRFKSRQVCGPYNCTRGNASDTSGIGFYMESANYLAMGDSPIALRVTWCDEIETYTRINHTGCYSDDDGMGDTIRGIVARLPRSRGFLIGWSMGPGMCSTLDTDTIYTCERDAAHAANDCAERAAERERAYQRADGLRQDIESQYEHIAEYREHYATLASELREFDVSRERIDTAFPHLRNEICSQLTKLRMRVRNAVREIRELRERVADIERYELN